MAGWPPGAASRSVDLDVPVHLTEYGDPTGAHPILCLHGLGASALNFGALGPLLAGDRRVVVPDLLGHGRSPASPPEEGAVEAQLRMLERLVEAECGGSVTLVGHSMGGILALLHALRSPTTVDRLVLLDPPVPNPTSWPRDPRLTAKLALLRLPGMGGLVARQALAVTPEQYVDRQLASATPHVDRIPVEAVRATVAETRATREVGGGRAAQRDQFRAIVDVVALLARPAAWRRQLAGITAPVLWLQGEDDLLARASDARVLAGALPGWDFRTRAGIGHLPHLEDPEWTAATITGWLTGTHPRPEDAARSPLP